MKTLICILVLVVISTGGCQSENLYDENLHSENLYEREFIGLRKSDVRQILGEPDKIEESTKNTEHIWGPIEDIWYQMQMGDKIVIWTYETEKGRKELYFLNDEPEVVGEFFWHKDHRKNPDF